MLIHIQFPIADIRAFAGIDRLAAPGWPSPIINEEFLRSGGIARKRWGGGLAGWTAEESYCEAKRAIRFDPSLVKKAKFSDFRIAFRRFFSDGVGVAKFEVGISVRGRSDTNSLSEILSVISLPVKVRGEKKRFIQRPIYDCGKALASLYVRSSTAHIDACKARLVVAGMPAVFVVARNHEVDTASLPTTAQEISVKDADIKLFHYWAEINGRLLHVWICIENTPLKISQSVRNMRLFVLRLNAEHQTFVRTLKAVGEGKIAPLRGTPASEVLQKYLNRTTSVIKDLSTKVRDFAKDDSTLFGLAAAAANETISPAEVDTLLSKLEQLDVRHNVFRKVEVQAEQSRWPKEFEAHGPRNKVTYHISLLNIKLEGLKNMVPNSTGEGSPLLAFAFGCVFLGLMFVANIFIPNPTPSQFIIFRIILALAAGGIAAVIPGFIHLKISPSAKFVIRAGGALAVFVVVYFYTPALLPH